MKNYDTIVIQAIASRSAQLYCIFIESLFYCLIFYHSNTVRNVDCILIFGNVILWTRAG